MKKTWSFAQLMIGYFIVLAVHLLLVFIFSRPSFRASLAIDGFFLGFLFAMQILVRKIQNRYKDRMGFVFLGISSAKVVFTLLWIWLHVRDNLFMTKTDLLHWMAVYMTLTALDAVYFIKKLNYNDLPDY